MSKQNYEQLLFLDNQDYDSKWNSVSLHWQWKYILFALTKVFSFSGSSKRGDISETKCGSAISQKTFLFNEYFDERRKMTFLVALLECLRGSRRSEILITIRQRLICLPPPVKKSNNYIIQPSYTTDAQKCDKNSTENTNSSFKEFGLDFAHAQGSTNCKGAWEEKDPKNRKRKTPWFA